MNKIELPAYENIPDVGLYLDQVTKYVNTYLNKDYALTANMISNYVKLKIVPKGHKKTYSREHIAYFLLIAYFKIVLSMEQINKGSRCGRIILFRWFCWNRRGIG